MNINPIGRRGFLSAAGLGLAAAGAAAFAFGRQSG